MKSIKTFSKDHIHVLYSYIDGAHFFTSRDPIAKGLCVAHADLQTAFNEVSYQLTVLLQKNQKVANPAPKSLTPFEELEKWAKKEIAATKAATKDDIFIPLPTAKVGWNMSNEKAAA